MGLPARGHEHHTYGDYRTWADDRLLTIYRLEDGAYGKPEIVELEGETVFGVIPEVAIQWEALAERLPEPEPEP